METGGFEAYHNKINVEKSKIALCDPLRVRQTPFTRFVLALKREGGTVCTNTSEVVCANCILFGWVVGELPFMIFISRHFVGVWIGRVRNGHPPESKNHFQRPRFAGIPAILRSGKLQNESFPNFSNFRPEFCPEFCSEFSPNFSRTIRASFRGRRRPEKYHQKSPPFFNAKFPGKHRKNIHKTLLESRQSKQFHSCDSTETAILHRVLNGVAQTSFLWLPEFRGVLRM